MSTATDEAKYAVLKADDARLLALLQGDADACADVLSDNLVFWHSSGRIDSKKSYVDSIRTAKYLVAQRNNEAVHVNGNTAWMQSRINLQIERDAKVRDYHARVLSVWILENGKWKMVAYSASV